MAGGDAAASRKEEKTQEKRDVAASRKEEKTQEKRDVAASRKEEKTQEKRDVAASRKEEKTREKRDVEAFLKANQVDVSKSESRVWLWKVTPPVYKAWQSAFTKAEKDNDGGSLGSVFVTVDLLEGTKTVTGNIVQDPTMPREMIESLKQQAELDDKSSKSERNREITMELPAYGSKTTPDTYSLVHTDFPGPVYIFSETSEGKVVVDGLVYQKYDSKPSLNSFRKYTVPTKGSKIKECSGNEQNKPQMLNLTVPGNEKRTGHPLKNQQNKKVRMDPDKLQEVLFVLFEKQPRYTFTELVSQTAQPQDFLKKSLDQICVKVKEGGKTFYEIKPEYKGQGHN